MVWGGTAFSAVLFLMFLAYLVLPDDKEKENDYYILA